MLFLVNVKKKLHFNFQPPAIDCELTIGTNLFEEATAAASKIADRSILLTTDTVLRLLPSSQQEKIILASGESIKSRAIKEKIEDAFIERGIGRNCCLIAAGGGALLDLAGFVAATYCRSIPFISVPTTLLAMTDAAVGGKTAVNVEEAKNWIGAFHHPKRIFLDLNFLTSLPPKEFVYGISETVKHGLIYDSEFFEFLEGRLEKLLKKEADTLLHVIAKSCEIKKKIVEKDPYETQGYRRILNFGHTIGHALETLSNYSMPHGQAVFMGMLVEAAIARNIGFLAEKDFLRIAALLKKIPLTFSFPSTLPYELLKRDKKGAHRFVVLTAIGKTAHFDGEYVTELTSRQLNEGWQHAVRHA